MLCHLPDDVSTNSTTRGAAGLVFVIIGGPIWYALSPICLGNALHLPARALKLLLLVHKVAHPSFYRFMDMLGMVYLVRIFTIHSQVMLLLTRARWCVLIL